MQTVLVVGVLLLAGGAGYFWRYQARQNAAVADAGPADDSAAVAPRPGAQPRADRTGGAQKARPTSQLGDLSQFRTITQDTRDLLDRGDQSGATTRVTDLETAWDDAEARLKPRDPAAWTAIDGKIDTVLRELRSTSPDPGPEKAALDALLSALR